MGVDVSAETSTAVEHAEALPLAPGQGQPIDGVRLTALGVGHAVVDSYGHTLLAPMFPLIASRLGLGLDDIGTLPIMMGLTASFAQPLIGLVTDRWPRVPAVAIGPALVAVFIGMVAFASSYWSLACLMFLAGIGIGAYHPQGASLARDAARGRGLAMSSFTVGGNVGFAVAPLLGAAYFEWFGLERFYFAAIPGMLFGIAMLAVVQRRDGKLLQHAAHSRGDGDRAGDWFALTLLTGTVTVRAAVQIAMGAFLAFLLSHRFSLGEREVIGVAGVVLSVYLMATAVSGPIGGHLSDRFGRRAVMIVSLAAAPFIFSLALRLPGYWLVAGLAAGGFVLMLPHPANVVMAQEYVPRRAGVAASMITGIAWGLGQFLSWPLGALAERVGIETALQIVVWLPFLGVFMVLPLRDARTAHRDGSTTSIRATTLQL
jgi:FSR family fosmidomycin resistance protein-like MFS transporter